MIFFCFFVSNSKDEPPPIGRIVPMVGRGAWGLSWFSGAGSGLGCGGGGGGGSCSRYLLGCWLMMFVSTIVSCGALGFMHGGPVSACLVLMYMLWLPCGGGERHDGKKSG